MTSSLRKLKKKLAKADILKNMSDKKKAISCFVKMFQFPKRMKHTFKPEYVIFCEIKTRLNASLSLHYNIK